MPHHHHHSSSSLPACFRPSTTASDDRPPLSPPPTPVSGNPNITICLYQTHLGLFSLTWSRTFLGHSLYLHLHPIDTAATAADSFSPVSLSNQLSLSSLSFHLHIKPFTFWKKQGSKKLHINNQKSPKSPRIQVFWDLSRAKFGSRPEPHSGFFIAVVVTREMILLVGDLTKEACVRTKAQKPERAQALILRREHLFGNGVYTTKARFGGKNREISIDCSVNSDARLYFSIDNKRVLQIKRLKWKFRGNERIEVDGVPIQVSWDVYNWLFKGVNNGEHAVFMLRFEDLDLEEDVKSRGESCSEVYQDVMEDKNDVVPWQQNSCINGIEWRKMRKSLMRTARSSSSSSISMSSASSGCSSSVMEWSSMEENELCAPSGFSLLVYAWRK